MRTGRTTGESVDEIAACISHPAFSYYLRLQRVKEHVERNIGEPANLITGARVASLEPKYFSAYFREKVGVGFKTWVHCVQLHHAREMLKTRNHSISEVAEAVGFRGTRTFERVFKKYHNITARQYRRRARPDNGASPTPR